MGLEEIRHKLSAILINTDENNPLKCDIYIGEEESQGLSTLQMTHIIEIFQLPKEGIIYFKLEGYSDFLEFDELSKSDLINILKYYEKI